MAVLRWRNTLGIMQAMNKNNILAGLVIALLALGAWWFTQSSSHLLPIAEGDTVASWDFPGPYKDGGELEKRARDEITRSEGLLGGDQSGTNDDPTDYTLYVSIANQFLLLGDGKRAYEYLGRALKIDAEKTGLAWRNLGSLMERLGALGTARVAYSRAVEAQPNIVEYHVVRLQFLISHFSDDAAAIDAAFDEAKQELGETPEILQIKAEWQEKTGRIEDAIKTLQSMHTIMGVGEQNSAGEIARLRSL